MMSASVYWALPYSRVSSPSTSRSASLSAALSLILHVAKPVPVKRVDPGQRSSAVQRNDRSLIMQNYIYED